MYRCIYNRPSSVQELLSELTIETMQTMQTIQTISTCSRLVVVVIYELLRLESNRGYLPWLSTQPGLFEHLSTFWTIPIPLELFHGYWPPVTWRGYRCLTYLTGISGSNQWSLFSVSYSRSAIIGTPKIEEEKKRQWQWQWQRPWQRQWQHIEKDKDKDNICHEKAKIGDCG